MEFEMRESEKDGERREEIESTGDR